MALANYEIALELIKLIQPQIQEACKTQNCPDSKPEEYAEFLSKVFIETLDKIKQGKGEVHTQIP